MSDPYKKAKPGRLTFKGGELAALKSIDKKKKKKKKEEAKQTEDAGEVLADEGASAPGDAGEGAAEQAAYTIDAAKRMKYEELFPVESRKFAYDPANKSRSGARTAEEALDDRVKKKADRYCK